MIELAKHIEVLLLENDCVIVPGLGGFIAHNRPAEFKESANVFCPPVRTIGFNPQLVMNDGLLVQSYMQAYNTDFPDATRMIEKVVSNIKEQLYRNGQAEIENVGTLYYTMNGVYGFEPLANNFFNPHLYGLGSFTISPLSSAAASETACGTAPVIASGFESGIAPETVSEVSSAISNTGSGNTGSHLAAVSVSSDSISEEKAVNEYEFISEDRDLSEKYTASSSVGTGITGDNGINENNASGETGKELLQAAGVDPVDNGRYHISEPDNNRGMDILPESAAEVTLTRRGKSGGKDKGRLKRIFRKATEHIVGTAAAVILFFVLSTPVENTYIDNASYASLGAETMLDAIRDRSWVTSHKGIRTDNDENSLQSNITRTKSNVNTLKPVAIKSVKVGKAEMPEKNEKADSNVKADRNNNAEGIKASGNSSDKEGRTSDMSSPGRKEDKKADGQATDDKNIRNTGNKSSDAISGKKSSFIIVSSLPTKADAEKELQRFKSEGYSEAMILESNGRFRIALYSYTSSDDAYKKVNELRKEEKFKSAWVFKSR